MHTQSEDPQKENTIRNSKLEMSIKPFAITKEESRVQNKSQSVDKVKRGISRVHHHQLNNTTINNLNNPVYNSNNNQQQINKNAQIQSHRNSNATLINTVQPVLLHSSQASQNWNSAKSTTVPNPNFQKAIENDLRNKVDLLEKELVALEKQYQQVENDRNQWKSKCGELFECNQKLGEKVQQLQKQIIRRDSPSKNRSLETKIFDLEEQLRNKNTKIFELQKQINKLNQDVFSYQQMKNENASIYTEFQFLQLNAKILETQAQNAQTTETLRQQLIKNSAILQQKQSLQSKLTILNYQLQDEQSNVKKMKQKNGDLEKYICQIENELKSYENLKKEVQQLYYFKLKNEDLIRQVRQRDQKIHKFQQKRLNQIQFHQQEVKRILNNESLKYVSLIEQYKNQRDNAYMKLQQQSKNNRIYDDSQRDNRIQQMSEQYENLVLELRNKVKQVQTQKQQIQNNRKYLLNLKQSQLCELIERINELKKDNTFLIEKLEKTSYQQRVNYRSRSPSPNKVQSTQFEQQNKILKQQNRLMNTKLQQYEIQFIKMQDQIHLFRIQEDKFISQVQSQNRKIKHLSEEIQYEKYEKQKIQNQKIKIVQDFESKIIMGKSKQNQLKKLELKIKESENIIAELSKKAQQYELVIQLQKQNLLISQSQSQKTIKCLSQKLKMCEDQISKYEQCVKLLKQEATIYKQKLNKNIDLSKKLQSEDKIVRISFYKQVFKTLQLNMLIDQLTEDQILSLIIKSLNSFIFKIKSQCHQLSGNENAATKLLMTSQQKCLQLEHLIVNMEQAHNDKLILVKTDYDVLYGKYLKYKNIVKAQNLAIDRARSRSKDKQKRLI